MRKKPQRRRIGMVDEQTSPSFHPMMHDKVIATITVVMSCRIDPKTAPLIPARSLVPFEMAEVSEPAEFESWSK
jgi:hypothetical protein